MKLNEDKCHLPVGGYKHESIQANIGDARFWESNKQKLLGVHIDIITSFDKHISNSCKKSWSEIVCFNKVVKFNTKEKSIPYTSAPYGLYIEIAHKKSFFHYLPQKHRNMQSLAIKLYKIKKCFK